MLHGHRASNRLHIQLFERNPSLRRYMYRKAFTLKKGDEQKPKKTHPTCWNKKGVRIPGLKEYPTRENSTYVERTLVANLSRSRCSLNL